MPVPLFKHKLTEQDAALTFVSHLAKVVREGWPAIYHSLRSIDDNIRPGKPIFTVDDEQWASFDLYLAVAATDMQSVKDLFPGEQGERIRSWILRIVAAQEQAAYAAAEMSEYSQIFERSLKIPEDPIDVISVRLLHKWLGESIANYEVVVEGSGTAVVSPLLVTGVNQVIVRFCGTWKSLKERYNLVQGDIPL
jgi:hypothetical protein